MEECKKRYCAWLKAIAIVVLSLFILNNLVWANPDFFQRSVTNVTLQQNLAALAGSVETSIQLTAQAAISTVGFSFFAERPRKFYPEGPENQRAFYESHPDAENGWEGENLVLDCKFGEKHFDVLVSPGGEVLGVREKPGDNTYWGRVGEKDDSRELPSSSDDGPANTFKFVTLPDNPYVSGEVLFAAPDTWKDDVRLEEIDKYVERTKAVILEAAETYHSKTGRTPVVALLSYHTTNSKDTRIPAVDDTSSSLSAAYLDEFEQGKTKVISKLSLTGDADNAEFDKVYVQIIERAAILAKKEAEDKGFPIVFLGQGNIQFDAAVISSIYERKTGMEAKEGEFPPNVFIFPNRHSLEFSSDLAHVGYRNSLEARSDFVTIASSSHPDLEAPSILDGITARLKSIEPAKLPRIFFPETIDAKTGGLSVRVISSAMEVARNGLAKVTLVYHDAEVIKAEFPEIITLIEEEKLEIIDPREINKTDKTDLKANLYAARKLLRRAKKAKKPAGLVAGAELDTAQIVLLSAWFKARDVSALYDYFLMLFPDAHIGEQGLVLYANTAVQECPGASGIKDMAISSAQAFEGITSKKAKIALITSSEDDLEKVNEAWKMLKEEYPDLDIGAGPMKLEEALENGFNVVIFPDLVSGNIGYKLTERILGARALGPIILGTTVPISDLSRGATNQDIRDTAAVLSSIAASQQKGRDEDGQDASKPSIGSTPVIFALGGVTSIGIGAIIALAVAFVIYKILRWYFSRKPLILKEKMDDVLFVKGDKKIYFPGKILSKLHHMTKIARELKIEMSADVEIKDGKAVDIIYEDDPNKIAVITADLSAETLMNTNFYYTETYMALGGFIGWSMYYLGKDTGKELSKKEIRERLERSVQRAKEAFSRHNSKISFFSKSKGERIDLDDQNILNVLDLPEDELRKFAEDIDNISTAATEWIGATSLSTRRRRKEGAKYIHFHNHPIRYPSPPSAIREGKKEWGDIYAPGFFGGRVSGLILDTKKGDELFLLYEPDDSNKQQYIDMYEKYWEEGDVVENRKASILEDLRKISMTPTDKINLEALQLQIRDIVRTKVKDIMLEERYRKKIKVVERKKGGDRATIADVKIGKLLKKKLTKLIPGSVVIEEESFTPEHFEKSKKARFVWVVDPIDGTAAYEEGVKEGNDEYCVGICLLYNGKPILSTVYAPEYEVAGHTGCLFEARDDLEGAYLNGERIQMDQGVDFENGRCITHIHKDEKHKRNDIEEKVAGLFGTDGTIEAYVGHSTLMHYCFVASGIHRGPQAFTRRKPNLWDVIQSAYIVEKAGGVVMHLDGQSISPVNFDKLEVVEEEKDGKKNYKLLVPLNIACSSAAKDRILDSIEEAPDPSANGAAMPLIFAMGGNAAITTGMYILLGIILLFEVGRLMYDAGLFQRFIRKYPMAKSVLHSLYGLDPEEKEIAEILLRNAPAPYHIIDHEGKIIRVNPMWLETMGYKADEAGEVIGKNIFDFLIPEQRENAEKRFKARIRIHQLKQLLTKHDLSSEARLALQREHIVTSMPEKVDEHGIKYKDRIYVGKDGRSIIAMTDDTITENFVVTSFQDITELREAENEKEEMARRDPATDFYNIRHLKAELGELIRRSKATGKTASVLMINLDSFEEHRNIADEFAIAMEGKIAESLSEIGGEDPYTITYVGNGVFGVIVRGDDKQAVLKKNTRITRIIPRKLKQIVSCGGKSYTLHGTISIGISVFPEDGKDVKDLIHSANLALEDSREQEGNTAVYCNDELMRKDKRRRDLTRRLQSALLDPDENGFFLNFQRKIDVKTGEIVGREVYTRWNDPEIRWVTPNEFIPIAEEQGWIGCLTEWVLLEACRKTRAWQDRGHYVSAAVNISVRDLQREDPNLVLSIKKILEETGVDPSLLRLELTEREDINVEQIAPTLHELRKLGIGIDIDDYGRGQDRLGELPDLPFDKLKLDMAFMIKIRKDLEKAREKGIDVDAIIADIVRILGEEELPESVKTEEQVKIWEKLRDRIAIISSTIDLTHKMKKKIIAESVETEEQLALLKNLGCDEAQGFYIGMPETSEQIDEELEREKSDSPPETRGKVWRDVRYTEEMLLCLIEEMISLGFNKEIVLAFDADIGTDQVVNPLDGVLAALSNLKQNPRYAPILKNLKIITASPENMRSSIEETAGKDAEVFMFSRYRHHVKLAGLELEERVHAVYIDELIEEGREFGKRAYYPLAEIVVISIAQAIAPIIAKNKITTVLKVPGLEDIVLHDINIESVLQKGNTLFFTLLPDAKEYDMSELIKKYAELKRFLKAA